MTQERQPEYPTETQMKERQREQEHEAADAESSELPEYPTNRQIEESYNAWKSRGEQGILEFLKKQRQEREPPRDSGLDDHSATSETSTSASAPAGKGTKRNLTWIASAIVWLFVGLGLGLLIGDHIPDRFEKTSNVNVRFDTRTKQNCWTGPTSTGAVSGAFDLDAYLTAKQAPLPLCKNL